MWIWRLVDFPDFAISTPNRAHARTPPTACASARLPYPILSITQPLHVIMSMVEKDVYQRFSVSDMYTTMVSNPQTSKCRKCIHIFAALWTFDLLKFCLLFVCCLFVCLCLSICLIGSLFLCPASCRYTRVLLRTSVRARPLRARAG